MIITELKDKIILIDTPIIDPSHYNEIKKKYLITFPEQFLTYGDISTETIAEEIKKKGFHLSRTALCIDDDKSIGLEPPNTFYLNRGEFSFSISMYYTFLQFKVSAQNGTLFNSNKEIEKAFGRLGVIELYDENRLEEMLKRENMEYFATPKTLTECIRVNEGWDLNRVTRLKNYVEFAHFIHTWSQDNFNKYNPLEWGLGKKESEKILDKRSTTNVRESTVHFWKNYLMNKMPKIQDKDIEIDIVDPTFIQKRKPNIILLGEEFIKYDLSNPIIRFNYFGKDKPITLSMKPEKDNHKCIITSHYINQSFPESKIIIIRYDGQKRFTLTKYDEQKMEQNHETYTIMNVLTTLKNKFIL